jgi:hypothetical protein
LALISAAQLLAKRAEASPKLIVSADASEGDVSIRISRIDHPRTMGPSHTMSSAMVKGYER